MKKIKIIDNGNSYTLEDLVNQFMADHKVLDVKFQASGNGYYNYSVMIIYEE